MCDLFNSKSRLKTGYKVLAIKNGKYYSTFTGQEIKVGTVKKAPTKCKRLSYYWKPDVEDNLRTTKFYNPKFNGKTSAFVSLNSCQRLYRDVDMNIDIDYTAVIVKIVFDGIVIEGEYHGAPIIAGHTIKSIRKVRKVNNITI